MSAAAVQLAVRLTHDLPLADMRALSTVLQTGEPALQALRSQAGGVRVRQACGDLLSPRYFIRVGVIAVS